MSPSKPPSSTPSVVQLPGGITLRGLPFKVVDRNPDGSIKTLELLPRGERGPIVLYANEEWIRAPHKAAQ